MKIPQNTNDDDDGKFLPFLSTLKFDAISRFTDQMSIFRRKRIFIFHSWPISKTNHKIGANLKQYAGVGVEGIWTKSPRTKHSKWLLTAALLNLTENCEQNRIYSKVPQIDHKKQQS